MKLQSENLWLNAIGFQAIWWLAVLYREQSVPVIMALVALHFYGLSRDRLKEVKLVLGLSLVGIAADWVFVENKFIGFPNHVGIPLYLVALWLGFSSTVLHSLSWVFKLPVLAFVLGSIGGPLSYFAAGKLGAIEILVPTSEAMVALGAFWSVLFLAISVGMKRLSKQKPEPEKLQVANSI